MKGLCYEFVELESEASFQSLGKNFNGVLNDNALHFDNPIVKGDLVKLNLEPGLWIRKWKLMVLQPVTLHKLPAPEEAEKKYSLVYFLNPSLFYLKQQKKKVTVNSQHNIMFLSNQLPMDFNVLPKQPFYVLDITFTHAWLLHQFNDADPCFQNLLQQNLINDANKILTECCTAEEYKTLHELEVNIQADKEDTLFNRARVYGLICSFFEKVSVTNGVAKLNNTIRYDEMVKAESIIMKNLKALPTIETIASNVNMSVSSLLRQFKAMYGKSIYEYCLEKKMELAKKMMLDEKLEVNAIAAVLGYKQASPFIEAFTKWHGYSPGKIKSYR